jgi:phosphoribosylanthranilate isomerase
VITQVYTAQTPDEARAVARLGVDHVGVTISGRGLPGEVDASTGREIVTAMADGPSRCVALTVETSIEKIEDFAVDVEPDILHLCGDTASVGPSAVAELRSRLRRSGLDMALMQAIGVSGPESVDLALAFEPHVDWIILDSVSESVEGIGAAGVVHDWEVSREIVQATSVPVILAGGLGPDNVAEAIATVRPAGVDSLTRTNRYHRDGSFVKDLGAVERFVDMARARSTRVGSWQ